MGGPEQAAERAEERVVHGDAPAGELVQAGEQSGPRAEEEDLEPDVVQDAALELSK